MEVAELAYLVAVIEERSFTRGAARSQVVQSTVSAGIARLERQLGVSLLHRGSVEVVPTQAGSLVYRRALAILASVQAIRDDVAGLRRGLRGSVSVGVILSTGSLDLPGVLRAFADDHPAVTVTVSMTPGPVETLLDPVRDGVVDMALVPIARPVPKDVTVVPVARTRLVLTCHADDPLAEATTVDVCVLRGRTFVDFPSSWGNRRMVEELFAARGETFEVRHEAPDVATALAFVRAGLGPAFVPVDALPAPGIRRVDLRPGPPEVVIGLARSTIRPAGAAARALAETVLRFSPALDRFVPEDDSGWLGVDRPSAEAAGPIGSADPAHRH